MIIYYNGEEVSLNFSTRNVRKILQALGAKDLTKAVVEGYKRLDIDICASIIYHLTDGKFKKFDEVYDFFDEYKKINEQTLKKLYEELVDGFNDSYFFKEKLTAEEIEKMLRDPLSGSLEDVVEEAVRKATSKTVERILEEQNA